MATIHPIDTIVSDATIRNGQPSIAGTTILVTDLAASHLYRGMSPEELAENFKLDLGQVHAALAYYYQHKVDMDSWLRANLDESQQLLFELDRQGKLIRIE